MESTLELRRWREKPASVSSRRWVIVSTSLRQLLRTRFFKILLFLAWTAGLLMAAAGFVFIQSLTTGGWLENLAFRFGPQAHAIVSAFCALVLLYPDICIAGLFTAVFWVHSFIGLWLSLIALTNLVPRLITRDRASNALIIYLSRPLTSLDYLLGKLGLIVALILLLWTGPLLFGWVLSMAFAPDSDFFVYSFPPLCHALLFNLIGLVSLAAIALAISSLGKSSRLVGPLWLGVWVILGAVASIPTTPAIVKAASFSHDLQEVRQSIFRVDKILITAGETLPLLNREVAHSLIRTGERHQNHDSATSAWLGLGALVILSSVVLARKLRPE